MSTNREDYSVVRWFSDLEKHKCGYCKNENGSVSYGMWAEYLTVADYQDLIDRGWRRSGKYIYKPIMDQTCCPQYSICCDILKLDLSKSQKRIIKKFNKFLADGIINCSSNVSNTDCCDADGVNDIFIREGKNILACDKIKFGEEMKLDLINPNHSPSVVQYECTSKKVEDSVIEQTKSETKVEQNKKGSYKEGVGADVNKPPCKKAKLIRLEKKKEKSLKKGGSLEKVENKSKQKSLEEFIVDISNNSKHKLKLKLIRTSVPNENWDKVKDMEFELYKKYQMSVHNDSPEKLSMRSFERFLVHSPLQIQTVTINHHSDLFKISHRLFAKYQMSVHGDTPDECDEEQFEMFLVDTPLKPKEFPNGVTGPGYGSFHQQYWIDDKLIAVGVIDILPKCVSSVYFFYDPDYRNLTLGTYGSLRELYFSRALNSKIPDLKSYYMGFYIHSCPKMRYKGKLTPSYLLCPETYKWIPFEVCVPKLEVSKYSRLNDNLDEIDENVCTENDLNSIRIFFADKLMLFTTYKKIFRVEEEEFKRIGELVGKISCNRIIFVMN